MPTQTGSIDLKAAKAAAELAEDAQVTANDANNSIVSLTIDLNTAVNGGYTVSSETTIPDSGLNISATQFDEAVNNEYGTYVFVYNGSNWTLDSQVVDLYDYGITLADGIVPLSGAEINVELMEVDGFKKSLENQYNDILNEIDYSADQTYDKVVADQIDPLANRVNENAALIGEVNSTLNSIENKTSKIGFSQQYGFVIYGQDATPSEKFKLQLTANEINFVDGALGNAADINAQITSNMLNINTANIISQMKFGNYAFINRSGNKMSLKYLE